MATSLARTRDLPPAAALYDHPAVAAIIDGVEAELGGREQLLATLAHLPGDDPDTAYLLGLLADPRQSTTALSKLCRAGNVSLDEFLTAFKAGANIQMFVRTTRALAQFIPGVVTDVLVRAQPHDLPCVVCRGRGNVPAMDPKTNAPDLDKPPVPCTACDARGVQTHQADLDRQKLALSMANLLPKAGPAVAIDNRSVTVTDTSPQGFARLLEATDALLHGRHVRRTADVDVAPIEKIVVDPPANVAGD